MNLIHADTGEQIHIGQEVTTFRGEKAILVDFRAPLHAASTGRVFIQRVGFNRVEEYFPAVIGARIVL